MIKYGITFLITFIVLNLSAQQDSALSTDSGTISKEVVSSIKVDSVVENVKESENKIDSTSEKLLDSLYEAEDDKNIVIEEAAPIIESKREDSLLSKEVTFKNEKKADIETNQKRPSFSLKMKKNLKRIGTYIIQIIAFLFILGVLIALYLSLRKKIESSRFLTSTRLSLMDKEVQIACKYMENNYYDTDLTADKLCEELVTGTAFLEALFIKELGMSIEDFLKQVRINRSRKMLEKNPQMPLYEVAEKCGYSDNELFEKDFLSTTGLSFDDFISTIIR